MTHDPQRRDQPLDAARLAAEYSLDDLYENAPCGYLSTLPDGTILRANQTFLTWTGYPRDDLVGVRRFQELLSPGGRLYHETHYAPLLRMQGEVREVAFDVVCADNRRMPVLVNSAVRRDESGDPRLTYITIFNATDRRRYEQELLQARRRSERSEARVRILQRLTADLAATASVADVAMVIARLGGDAFDATAAIMWLLDTDQDDLVWTAAAGLPGPVPSLLSIPRGAQLPPASALREHDLVLVGSVEAAQAADPWFAETMRHNNWQAMAVLPMLADDELGVVALTFSATWSPDHDERELLRALGRQMGQALQRAQLFETERRLRARAEVLQRITAILASGLEPPAIATAAVTELVENSVADMAMVALAEDEGERLVPVSWRGPGVRSADAWALLGLPTRVPTGSTGTEEPCFDRPAIGPPESPPVEAAAGALVTLPLAVDGWHVGLLCLGYREPRRFSSGQRAFLTAFASQCAQAFARAHLHRETTQQAQRSAFLARLGSALDEVPGLIERAHRLVDLLVPELASWASVTLVDVNGTWQVTEAPGRPDPRVIVDDVAHATATVIATGKGHWIDSRDPQGGEPAPAAASRHTSDRVAVALPLRARGTVLGALTILARESGSFRNADLSFLDDLTYRCALAFENARLYEHERDTAHVLQQSLLTGEPPDDPRIEVATRYLPGTANLAVGGDWYDTFTVTGSRIGIVVGDVVGRGINAASTMGQLRSATRALAGAQLGPARILEHLDRFVDRLDAGQMATLVYAEICLDTGVMRYACAGHPPPVLIEKAREPQILWGGRSLPLGIDTGNNERTDAELVLRPGARLLLYTDGLVETRTESITDGIARLVKELSQHREQPPAALLRTLTDAMLHGHQGDDDVCLLCLSFNGPEAVRRTRSG